MRGEAELGEAVLIPLVWIPGGIGLLILDALGGGGGWGCDMVGDALMAVAGPIVVMVSRVMRPGRRDLEGVVKVGLLLYPPMRPSLCWKEID